jgi:hypothetical protein
LRIERRLFEFLKFLRFDKFYSNHLPAHWAVCSISQSVVGDTFIVENVPTICKENFLIVVKWVLTDHTKFLISLPMNMGREYEPPTVV